MVSGQVSTRNFAVIETSTSVKYRLPIYDRNGNPGTINKQPQTPFDQVSIVGDTATVSDRRASQIIPVDQTLGAGRDAYNETEGITDYRQSDADPRAPGAIVARPKRVLLGDTLPNTGTEPWRIAYTGYAGASIHAYAWGARGEYHTTGDGAGVWNQWVGDGGNGVYGYFRGLGYTFFMANTGNF